jgi:UTP-glucose-1-phosphate uridylyltransferase
MQKPTLLVLAAGMGSRYGSLKQMDGLGPGGETIMDYSVFDAIRAGFGKVVFVIRNGFADDFRAVFSQTRYKNQIEVAYVMQELENIPPLDSARGPEKFTIPAERTKPWGTNHAVMMAAGTINEPFAVINADDYYGRHAFQVLGDFLKSASAARRMTTAWSATSSAKRCLNSAPSRAASARQMLQVTSRQWSSART